MFLQDDQTSTHVRPPAKPKRPLQAKAVQSLPTEAEYPEFWDVNITYDFLHDQNEPSVSVNTKGSAFLVAGANDYRTDNALWAYRSTNGGLTWINQQLPVGTTLALATDPAVAFDRSGEIFYSNGRQDAGGMPFPRNEVAVYTYDNTSWKLLPRPFQDTTRLAQADVLSDKYYLAVDDEESSPHAHSLYVAWVEYQVGGASRIVLSKSTTKGQSWGPRQYLSAAGSFITPVPAVAHNGDLYVVFQDKEKKEILVVRSFDGGQTFSSPTLVSKYRDLGPVVPEGNRNARPYIKDFIGVNSFPSIAVNRSIFQQQGRVYVSWAGREALDRAHIYLTHSDDRGQSWSAPRIVEANPSDFNTDRFFNWVAVDRAKGDVGIVYYDSRTDSINNRLVDVFLSHSRDGGTTFTSRRISSASFDPHVTTSSRNVGGIEFLFFGDYINVDGFSGMWHPVWTDTRSGNDQDIFTARVNPYAPTAVRDLAVTEVSPSKPRLTWSHIAVSTFGYPLIETSFRVYRDDQLLATLTEEAREFFDDNIGVNTAATYRIVTVGTTAFAGADTSISRFVRFIPSAIRRSMPIELVYSRALPDGFSVTMRIPDRNEAGESLTGIDSLYLYIDGALVQVLGLADVFMGTEQTLTFQTSPGTYHQFTARVSTRRESFTTLSAPATAWLWAGESRTSYQEDMESTPDVFTTGAWAPVSIPGVGGRVLQDSIVDVLYLAGTNTWFLLPSTILDDTRRSLEFDHAALVAPQDAARIELSTDNGIHFRQLAEFDIESHPASWKTSIAASTLVHGGVDVKQFKDSAVVVRFRLEGPVGEYDGWYLDNLRFTDLLGVTRQEPTELRLVSTLLRTADAIVILLAPERGGDVRLDVVDVLGRVIQRSELRVSTGMRYRVPFQLTHPGTYFVRSYFNLGERTLLSSHKVTVLP